MNQFYFLFQQADRMWTNCAIPVAFLFILFASYIPASSQGLNSTDLSNPGIWKYESQRPELLPVAFIDDQIKYEGKPTLALASGGKDYTNGCWFTEVPVTSGEYYRISAKYLTNQVEEPYRSVIVRVIWYDEEARQIEQAEYPAVLDGTGEDGWQSVTDTYEVPGGVAGARIELVYRWDADGRVNFGGIKLEKIEKPSSRPVRLATIHHRPVQSKSSEDNLRQFAALIEKAAAQKADIVCLPEAVTMVGTNLNYISASEPVPGPSTVFLGEIARKHQLYIVAGILEKSDELVYNTAVLIDRQGQLAGKYRKVSLPREEIDGGVTPGSDFPVFETDFGIIGMMICWDVTFPEAARALAFNGAEVILMPIAGGHLTLARARALENQVYLVSSTYDMKSAIFDLEGEILREATDSDQVVVVEVDLNQRKYWPWLGDFKNRIRREMPPSSTTPGPQP